MKFSEQAEGILDVFCHILPREYVEAVPRDKRSFMFQRAVSIPVMVDLEARFRVMDKFPGYRQVPSLASPLPEQLAGPGESLELARRANDAMAALCEKYPERFESFVAALPLNNPDASMAEAERAVVELGAAGVQITTSVDGKPVDRPEHLQLFGLMAEKGRAVWLHPVRPMTRPEYPSESVSKYDIWWSLGWPFETSAAMVRLVFAGLFDRWPGLVVITHHVGGMIPMMEGRMDSGMELLGTRTPVEHAEAVRHPLRTKPVEALRRFYADTASFGSSIAIEAGKQFFGLEQLMFATDMPFDPEGGPGYIRGTLKALGTMKLSEQERRAILNGNACRALGRAR